MGFGHSKHHVSMLQRRLTAEQLNMFQSPRSRWYKPDLASMLVQEAPEVVDLVGRAPRRKRRTNNGAVDAQKIRRIIRKRGKRLKTARAGATTTRHREEDGEQSLLDEEEEEEDDQEERRSASRAS